MSRPSRPRRHRASISWSSWNAQAPAEMICCVSMALLYGRCSSTRVRSGIPASRQGLMEFAGVDKAARWKMGVWKMQEWTYQHDVAKVDIAGVDNAAPCGRGGQMSMQEWTYRHGMWRVDNAGEKKCPRKLNWKCVVLYINFVHPRKIEITKQTQISKY